MVDAKANFAQAEDNGKTYQFELVSTVSIKRLRPSMLLPLIISLIAKLQRTFFTKQREGCC